MLAIQEKQSSVLNITLNGLANLSVKRKIFHVNKKQHEFTSEHPCSWLLFIYIRTTCGYFYSCSEGLDSLSKSLAYKEAYCEYPIHPCLYALKILK